MIILIILIYLFYVGHHGLSKLRLQKKMYFQAEQTAKNKGKKLLVIGDPKAGMLNAIKPGNGYGDVCIDLYGCTDAPKNSKNIIGKLEDKLSNFNDNSVVIFESETLEYVNEDQLEVIINEMKRISGNDIYSVHSQKSNPLFVKYIDLIYSTFNKMMHKPTINHVQRYVISSPPESDYQFKKIDI